ncbi:hypothetical protein CLCR_07753 [Cladophialophora carrionii]|uniref:Uncharacterized protein n=1 Tax=Cladophialophora carrionii TaxID=86049 RepID=A0A1C1CN52_9EURO|nr:hypothetical protein CLCR_07753 [Cladophialophora carrionii]
MDSNHPHKGGALQVLVLSSFVVHCVQPFGNFTGFVVNWWHGRSAPEFDLEATWTVSGAPTDISESYFLTAFPKGDHVPMLYQLPATGVNTDQKDFDTLEERMNQPNTLVALVYVKQHVKRQQGIKWMTVD